MWPTTASRIWKGRSLDMDNLKSVGWWKAAGIRAAKTVGQTALALLATGNHDVRQIGEAALLAGLASLGTSLAGLPELAKDNG